MQAPLTRGFDNSLIPSSTAGFVICKSCPAPASSKAIPDRPKQSKRPSQKAKFSLLAKSLAKADRSIIDIPTPKKAIAGLAFRATTDALPSMSDAPLDSMHS